MSNSLAVKNNNSGWTKVITAKKRLLDLHLRDIWDYRYLIKMFIKRDFVVTYKQTILGPIWYLVQPLVSSIMYMFVFGKWQMLELMAFLIFSFILPEQCSGHILQHVWTAVQKRLLQIRMYSEKFTFLD